MSCNRFNCRFRLVLVIVITTAIIISKYKGNIWNIFSQRIVPYIDSAEYAALQKNPIPELIQIDYVPITIWTGPNSIKSLCLQQQIKCTTWEKMGNKNDGSWAVCLAKPFLPKKPCTIYSFGINFDFSFDDTYRSRLGCTVRSFDPSMNTKQHEHSPSVWFYPIGLSDKEEDLDDGWKMNTFKGILTHFKDENKTIPYFKFDIEHYEWRVLTNLLHDGVLQNVMQMSFEIHVTKPQYDDKTNFDLIKRVENAGFKRWFSYCRAGWWDYLYQCDMSFLNIKFIGKSFM